MLCKRSLLLCLGFIFISFIFLSCNEDSFKGLRFYGFEREQLSPEAQEGLSHIFKGDLFRNALPLSIYSDASKSALHPPQGMINLSSEKGQFLAYGRLPSPPGREGTLPFVSVSIGNSIFKRGNFHMVNDNCFSCHAGVVHGVVAAGLGNSHIDQVPIVEDLKKLIMFSGSRRDPKTLEEENEFKHLLGYAKTVLLPSFKYAQSRGDNLGPFGVWKVVSRLVDPEFLGLETYPADSNGPLDQWFDQHFLPTVDPNPWWHMRYKNTSYRYGDGGPYDASHFSLNFTHPHSRVNEDHKSHVERVSKALAFARETLSPPYPHELDPKKIETGRKLFHGEINITQGTKLTCYKCHGTYILSQPKEWKVYYRDHEPMNVGTDVAYSELLIDFRRLEEHAKKLEIYYSKRGEEELTPRFHAPRKVGYLAPLLVGVWASAPYFHNGSVPTVRHVLNSKERPMLWKRENKDPFTYDFKNLGLSFLEINEIEYLQMVKDVEYREPFSKESIDFRAIYNVRDKGKSNSGHHFGDSMMEEERDSVIEFLKSLSGPNIVKGG